MRSAFYYSMQRKETMSRLVLERHLFSLLIEMAKNLIG